ncbi:MAG: tyrosine-type recombinase/integrase [Vicinamibacterales bacterium]
MLSDDADRYIALRRVLGFKLRKAARHLQSFARFAADRGDTRIRAATAVAWAATVPTPDTRDRRLGDVARFARFLHAEDTAHEMPRADLFAVRKTRPIPYIYTRDELVRILDAAAELRRQRPNPLRRQLYVTLFGLIAATGLRVSEALALRLDDVLPGGILHIRETKFCKSRLVPLHETAVEALDRYLDARRRLAGTDDHLFPSVKQKALVSSTVNYTFRCLLRRANIAPDRQRQPRIHDLRHTFATRVLEQCGAGRGAVARHFVALSTYLGHVDIKQTYWYLQATPELMADIADAAEVLVGRDAQ